MRLNVSRIHLQIPASGQIAPNAHSKCQIPLFKLQERQANRPRSHHASALSLLLIGQRQSCEMVVLCLVEFAVRRSSSGLESSCYRANLCENVIPRQVALLLASRFPPRHEFGRHDEFIEVLRFEQILCSIAGSALIIDFVHPYGAAANNAAP